MSNIKRLPSANSQEWARAAESAKETVASASESAQQAVSSIGATAGYVATDLGEKANELAAKAGTDIQGPGDRLGKIAPQTGTLGCASQAVAQTMKDGEKYIEGTRLSGITEDIARLIRRNPLPAVLMGIGLGWYLCRKLKG